MKSLTFILGTRPEIIKLAPLIRRAKNSDVPFQIIHSGQHYDQNLDGVFFQELKLPQPSHNLQAASGDQMQFFANVFANLSTLLAVTPSVVVVQGDTNTAFAGGFVARRLGIPVAHVESGLRSDDWTMPEEMNRVLLDRLASRLYVPTVRQMERLKQEGIDPDACLLTGNTVADAVREHLPIAESMDLPQSLSDAQGERYAVITLHRPALVDDLKKLLIVLQAIDTILSQKNMKGIFLVHPRTRAKLGQTHSYKSITLHEPVGYLPMLRLLKNATLILTDSGGLQEEAAILHVPCVTLRENTERPETIEAGGNRIVGFDAQKLRDAVEELLASPPQWKPLYSIEHPSDMMFEDLRTRYL